MNIVLDTNILVSAIWSPEHNAANVVSAVIAGRFTPCYDHRILEEYYRVLRYPKLGFSEWQISGILDPIIHDGLSVIADPLPDVPFERDETDRKFYEVAKFCDALLISGNLSHYPEDPSILSLKAFCDRYL